MTYHHPVIDKARPNEGPLGRGAGSKDGSPIAVRPGGHTVISKHAVSEHIDTILCADGRARCPPQAIRRVVPKRAPLKNRGSKQQERPSRQVTHTRLEKHVGERDALSGQVAYGVHLRTYGTPNRGRFTMRIGDSHWPHI